MNHPLTLLFIAILAEIIGTSALKSAAGFSRPLPSILVVVMYGITFYFLSLSLKTIPVNVAYAMWAGLGTAGIALIGWIFFKEVLTPASLVGIVLIVAGVVVLNLSGATHS